MNHKPLNQHAIQWASALLMVMMVGFYAWSFVYSVLVLDSSRDLYRATQISQLTHFPLLGPDVGGMFHTGPLWFYILAIPAFFGSLPWVAYFVGVLAGLKFVFAYLLGRDLINRRFGLIWALMLLIPGWQFLSQVFINHTNLLETLSLLFLLMLYRYYQRGDIKYGLWSALVLGLGFHAHPSFLVLVVFYVPLIWHSKHPVAFSHLLIAVLLFLLPLLPYLIDQVINGFPDWTRFLQHDSLQNQIKASGSALHADTHILLHFWQNLKAVLFGGPDRIITFVAAGSPQMGLCLAWLFGLVVVTSLLGIGWIMSGSTQFRKGLVHGSIWVLCALFLLTALRSFTPFYMLLPIIALVHGILALGFYQVISGLKNAWHLCLPMLFVPLVVLPFWALQKAAVNGQVNFGSVMNVNVEMSDDWTKQQNTLDLMSINESQPIADYFCDQSVTLHGPFTAVLDVTAAVPLYFYCDQFGLILGGQFKPAYKSIFVMHKSFWDQTGLVPQQWLSPSWGLTEGHQNHNSAQGLSLPVFNDYVHPPRSNHQLKAVKTHQLEIQSKASSYLVLSNMLPFNVQFAVKNITANHRPVELVVANAANRLYHCADCQSEPVTWRISLSTNDINVIDINTL
ncbi:glycosyltransferase family 39 protein [Marinicella litoralis]|uniref:Dolichyl-phosphate-mannose-protein mannosyltransferase n=1 Tax=Marinicella litoralis TaxID=644220 RepID=A0A4R6XQT8_9GAMM|nr:glycosyltransferase family 39 protein [Marinicella litoralis]TDR20344.1 dolichyl-phosphate-mannose-protein mannosyltransferase [Marinicella litoralis]